MSYVPPIPASSGILKHAATQRLQPREQVRLRAVLTSEDTYATVLLLLVLDRYGPDVLGWSPETIRLELEDDFQLQLPTLSLGKIMAGISLVTTNLFFKDLAKFIEICNVLSGDDFQPDEFDPADSDEILWGVVESMLIWPPDDDSEETEFSPEIRAYIGKVTTSEGIVNPVDVLRLGTGSDMAGVVQSEFADDPVMYSAVLETQKSHADEKQRLVQENLLQLRQQLQLLPLKTGQTDTVLQQLDRILQTEIPEA